MQLLLFFQCSDDDSPNTYFKLAVDGIPVKVSNPKGVLSRTEEDGQTGRQLTLQGFEEGKMITIKISNWTNRTSAEGGVATVSYIVDRYAATEPSECVEVDGGKLCDDMLVSYTSDKGTFFSYLGAEGFGMISECHDSKISGAFDLKAFTVDEKHKVNLVGEFSKINYKINK